MAQVLDQQAVKLTYSQVAQFFMRGDSLPDQTLVWYAGALRDLPPHAVVEALKATTRDPKRRVVPLPGEIRAMVKPEHETPDDAANKVAGDITAAISRFGYMRGADARAHLSPIAWRVVEAKGGWANLCANVTVNDTAFFAQCRELARAFAVIPQAQAVEVSGQLADASRLQIAASDIDGDPPSRCSPAEAQAKIRGIIEGLFRE